MPTAVSGAIRNTLLHLIIPPMLVSLAISCVGSIDGRSEGPAGDASPVSSSSPTPRPAGGGPTPASSENDPAVLGKSCVAGQVAAGPAPLRRLTREQYDATVSSLVGAGQQYAASLEGDESIGPFASNTLAPISEALVEKYGLAATSLAERVLGALATFAPCAAAATATDTACFSQFLGDFGKRVYRRPLAPTELGRYTNLFSAGAKDRSFTDGVRLAVRAMFQSPNFLYHVELGEPALTSGTLNLARLTSHEVAARLSFLLWNGARDAELQGAADSDQLTGVATIEAQARRMLAAPQAEFAIRSFHTQLTGVSYLEGMPKNKDTYPSWSPALAKELAAEPGLLANAVIRDGDASLTSLLTASFGMGGTLTAQLYGASGSGPRYELDPTQRAGLLTLPGVMAAHSSVDQSNPVKRAVWVRKVLLCQELAPPPNNLAIQLPKVSPNVSTRERFRQHRDNPVCAGCHTLLDPVGLGFEHYDAIGQYRADDSGSPVDVTGEIVGQPADIAGTFNGAVELAQKLSTSAETRNCFGRHWFRYALGREPTAEDDCARSALLSKFEATKGNIRELIVAIATSDSFRFRKVEP